MQISNGIIKVLTKVARILDELNIKYSLIGGLAVSMLSKPRATEDVDFLILLPEDKKKNLVHRLKQNFTIIQNKEPFNLNDTKIWRLILKEKQAEDYEFIVLDFLLVNSEYGIYKKAIDDALNINIFNTEIKVADVESLIEIKKLSNRKQDLIDIEELRKQL